MVESAVTIAIREEYKFNEAELDLQTGAGTETSIMRHISNTLAVPLTAILDLKSAYDQVPRQRLYNIVTKTQPESI